MSVLPSDIVVYGRRPSPIPDATRPVPFKAAH